MRTFILATAILLALASGVMASTVLFDRGLPSTNLNNAAGASRSNVTWASELAEGFTGDDFVIGTTGHYYLVDSLTVWGAQYDPLSLDIDNIWFYLARENDPLALLATGMVTGNTNSNPLITHSYVNYPDGTTGYQGGSGTFFPICQTTFGGLNYLVDGGVKYKFGVKGDKYLWWNHASNAALSGSTQEGADDKYLEFTTANLSSILVLDSNGYGWDKSSDINVRVTGTLMNQLSLVPSTASLYIRPGESILVNMEVANLSRKVNACQAMLGYSSTYFTDPVGGCVAPGGDIWDQVIWDSWKSEGATSATGEIDTAIGVDAQGTVGTEADATVAKITLTSKSDAPDGSTKLVFRADQVPDPGLIKSTFLSDMAGNPVWPDKTDSVDIIVDGHGPVITCPENITVDNDLGLCSAVVTIVPATATDTPAGVESVVGVRGDSLPLTDPYPVGVTVITWTATDNAGNISTCAQSVTVRDKEAPVIPDHADITVNSDPNVCTAVVTWDAIKATDNCDGEITVICSPASGSTFPKGDTTVTMTATDAAGNSSSKTFKVTVEDKQAPVVTSATAAPDCVKDQDVTITAVGSDNCTAPGSLTWEHSVGSGGWAAGLTVTASELSEGPNILSVRATDESGNTSLVFVVTNTVSRDTTPPVLTSITATQGGVDVLYPATAIQGIVDIYVAASDAGCAGMTQPVVVVDGITPTAFAGVAGGVYHYTVVVLASTANGAHTITVTAADGLGNTSVDSTKSIGVDKNRITGQVQLQGYVGGSRAIVFVATNGSSVLKTWTKTLTFAADTAGYTLDNVPASTTGLSAKSAWSLRRKLAASFNGDTQASVNFTGTSMLLGGDIDGSNSVNILDYGTLKANWGSTTYPRADINGDTVVNVADYNTMKSNWFRLGDAE